MKSIITKFRKELHEKDNQFSANTISPKVNFNSYKDMKQRAILGWIVYQMAEVLDIDDEHRNHLFFQSFTFHSFDEFNDENIRDLFQLAQQGINWLQHNDIIEEEIKSMNLSKTYGDVLSRVLSEIHTGDSFNHSNDDSKNVWEVYRDVIYAATQGAFLLIEKDKVHEYKQGDLLCEARLIERKDISYARNLAKEAFEQVGLPGSKVMSYNLIISEAVTNVFKHARDGKMLIYKVGNSFRIVIEDRGPGFPLKILPKTTLLAGFSTKESLGQGFTLMMKMARQVLLGTSSDGSTLILMLDGEGEK